MAPPRTVLSMLAPPADPLGLLRVLSRGVSQFERAVLCERLGEFAEAERLYRLVRAAHTAALPLGEADPETLRATMGVVNVLSAAGDGRRREAAELCRWVARVQTTNLGAEHPDTLRSSMNLATLLCTAPSGGGGHHTCVPLVELDEAEQVRNRVRSRCAAP